MRDNIITLAALAVVGVLFAAAFVGAVRDATTSDAWDEFCERATAQQQREYCPQEKQ